MSIPNPTDQAGLQARIHREMLDNADEQLEMELDDSRLGRLRSELGEAALGETLDLRSLCRSCLRLQRRIGKAPGLDPEPEAKGELLSSSVWRTPRARAA